MRFIIFITLFLYFIQLSTSQVVCSIDELLREIREDIEDNGKLDCLRNNIIPPNATKEQKIRIERANWNSDCSFEAEGNDQSDWQIKIKENYKLKKGLVDVNGDSIDKDYDDQADMCEIIRSFIANGLFLEISEDIKSVPINVIDYISCPGGESQNQICAVNSGSFLEKSKWYIPLDGQAIKINNEPTYIIDDI
jgi:hypothetical protein